VILPGAVGGHIRVSIRAEVSQAYERLAAGVFDFDTARGCIVADKDFVVGVLSEADHGRGLQGEFADASFALDGGPSASGAVFEDGFGAGLEGQFFGAKELFAIDAAIDNPLVGDPCGALGRIDDRFDVVGVFEVGIDVLFPVELPDDKIEVLMLVCRHVLDQQRPGHVSAFDDRLKHSENIRAPLGFVGAQRARSVENAWWNQPSGPSLESVSAGEVQDSVIAFVPIRQATSELVFGGSRFEAHEGVGEVVIDVVILGREVVAFGFPFLTDQSSIFLRLVHVVGDWSHVVEEFRIDRPSVVFAEDGRADELVALLGDGVLEEKLFAFEQAEAQAFVPYTAFVGRLGGAGEPAFIDTTSVSAVCVKIIRVEFDSAAWV